MIITTSDRIKHIKPYYFAGKMARIAELNKQGFDILNIGIGSPDLMPHKSIIDRLKESANNENSHGYQSYKGIENLRNAFSKCYERNFDINLDPLSEIQILMGSKEGIMHIAMSFLNNEDKVLVPDPGYPTYNSASLLAGADVIKYNLTEKNNWHPDFKELGKMDLSDVKIMWLNYPHMPTGAKATISLFEQAVEFAKKNKILLVNDNPYNFVLNDSPLSIFNIQGAKEVALELVSLSKTYNMAGWRIGALIGNSLYINEIIKFKSNMDSGMFKPIQEAGVIALNMDKDWNKYMNEIYKQRRNKVWEIMDMLKCTYDKNSTGMFVWGKTNIEDEEKLIEDILDKSRVFIAPGRIFGENGKGYLRISITNSIEKLNQALNRIKENFL